MKQEILEKIIEEEISKKEIDDSLSLNNEKLLKSKAFEKQVKIISAKVIEELYKLMWQRKSFWADSIGR